MKTSYLNKFLLVSAVTFTIGFTSCTQDGEPPKPPTMDGSAYLSVSIRMPEPLTKNGGPQAEWGSLGESSVTSGYAITLTDDIVTDVVTLTSTHWGTIGGGSGAAVGGEAFKVTLGINKLLLVLNPDTELDAVIANAKGMNLGAFLTGVTSAIENPIVSSDGDFTMINAGEWDSATEKFLVVCTPSDTKDDAEATRVEINVERLASKVKLAKRTSVNAPAGVTFDITGWTLNATNKTYIPYSNLVEYVIPAGAGSLAKYRMDANYKDVAAADLDVAFNWLDNTDNVGTAGTPIVWSAVDAIEYCHENTVEADAQNYNNLTKVVVKTTYAPAGVASDESWFRYRGKVYKTIEEMQAAYTAAEAGSDLRFAFDAFLAALGVSGSFSAGTIAMTELDDVDNGGYLAAKASVTGGKPVVQYFQKSVSYYDVNIRHDYRVDSKLLGRWGVVRNNYYRLTVYSVTGPGLPYIPDPTDPDITDPENPDPENPDPADNEAYLAVEVAVKPWTIWGQPVDL